MSHQSTNSEVDLHEAVATADCPECFGQGWVEGEDVVPDCCGRTYLEACCGEPIPRRIQTQEVCQFCSGTGKVPICHSGEVIVSRDDLGLILGYFGHITPPTKGKAKQSTNKAVARLATIVENSDV